MERFIFTCTPPASTRRTFGLLGDILQERFRDGAGHRWENSDDVFALTYGIGTKRACEALDAW